MTVIGGQGGYGGSGNWGAGGYGYGQVWQPKCRHEPTTPFHLGSAPFALYPASKEKIGHSYTGFDLWVQLDPVKLELVPKQIKVVDVTGEFALPFPKHLQFVEEETDPPPPPILDISWKDMSIPDMDWEWWVGFYQWLTDFAEANGKTSSDPLSVLVNCIGGHGRTGSFLAILLWMMQTEGGTREELWGEFTPLHPINWVRKRYCPEAIETAKQELYIEYLTNLKLPPKPAVAPAVKGK